MFLCTYFDCSQFMVENGFLFSETIAEKMLYKKDERDKLFTYMAEK